MTDKPTQVGETKAMGAQLGGVDAHLENHEELTITIEELTRALAELVRSHVALRRRGMFAIGAWFGLLVPSELVDYVIGLFL